MDFYYSIKKYVKLVDPNQLKNKKIKKSKLSGKTIVMSGFRNEILKKELEDLGVDIKSSVSKNTDYLVVKDKNVTKKNNDKIEKAKKLKINIITKDELEKLIKS